MNFPHVPLERIPGFENHWHIAYAKIGNISKKYKKDTLWRKLLSPELSAVMSLIMVPCRTTPYVNVVVL